MDGNRIGGKYSLVKKNLIPKTCLTPEDTQTAYDEAHKNKSKTVSVIEKQTVPEVSKVTEPVDLEQLKQDVNSALEVQLNPVASDLLMRIKTVLEQIVLLPDPV